MTRNRTYFNGCNSAEELRATYKAWCKKLHPDIGGDAEEFKRMQKEYQARLTKKINDQERNYTTDMELTKLVRLLLDLLSEIDPQRHAMLKAIVDTPIVATLLRNDIIPVQIRNIIRIISNVK